MAVEVSVEARSITSSLTMLTFSRKKFMHGRRRDRTVTSMNVGLCREDVLC